MAERGGQPGNENAKKARIWAEALKRALARHSGAVDKGLDAVAEQLIKAAVAGESWAIEHLADRMDGKARQDIDKTVTHIVDDTRIARAREALRQASETRSIQ